LWRLAGWLMVMTIYIILTFYSVITSWVMAYVFKAISGVFTASSPAEIGDVFAAHIANPWLGAFWHGLFMIVTVGIIARGLQGGIEKAVKIMMPALFVMLVGLMGYAAVVGDFAAAFTFLFRPDFGALNANAVLAAIGLAFFSIGTGMAIMMTYASYLGRDVSVVRSAATIVVSVPVAALCAGLVIFPLVFGHGLNPGEGPGLIFVTLPVAFDQMPGGALVGMVFFVLVFFAALTSAISGLQPIVAWAHEHKGVSRLVSAGMAGGVAWLLGLLTVLSFSLWTDVQPLAGLGRYGAMTIFDLIDVLTSNIMLPLSNILLCLFVGWVLPRALLRDEVGPGRRSLLVVWIWILRLPAPMVIAVLLVMGLM